LEDLHTLGFVHRDIKPQNILLGPKTSKEEHNKIFLVDFGLSNQYLTDSGDHIEDTPDSRYASVVGTAIFASINAHMGIEITRRDDVESLVYTLIYLLVGTLPWKNLDQV